MRPTTITTVTVITIGVIAASVFAFGFLRTGDLPNRLDMSDQKAETAAVSDVQAKLDELAGVLERYQQTNQEYLQQTRMQQSRLDKRLVDLDNRLQSVETGAEAPTTDRVVWYSEGQVAAQHDLTEDDAETASDTKNLEPKKVTESELSHWMDDTLILEEPDQESTRATAKLAEESLEKVPGVQLNDMQCTDGFCRATFASEDGESPAIGDLFGEPPFESEGFTVNQPDGRVVLYFTRAGESLDELRIEAEEAAHW